MASEVLAGWPHRRNYRHFIAHGGRPPLLTVKRFPVDQRQIVGDGAIGLYLALSPGQGRTGRPGIGRSDATA